MHFVTMTAGPKLCCCFFGCCFFFFSFLWCFGFANANLTLFKILNRFIADVPDVLNLGTLCSYESNFQTCLDMNFNNTRLNILP